MSLTQRLAELVRAAFTGIYVVSHEHDDALTEIAALCAEQGWSLATWDVDRGLVVAGQPAPGTADPVAAIKSVNAMAKPDGSALLVLPNFHRLLNGAEVVQALAHQVQRGKDNRTFVLVLAPLVQLPPELERQFVLVEHDLPGRGQLLSIAQGIATEADEMPRGPDLDRLLDASSGLTRHEAEGAFSLSLVREGSLRPDTVWELKAQALTKSGLLTLHRGAERFADLGGLDAMKRFCTKALASRHASARPRGILLLGVPGTGKSAFAKALGNEAGRPTLVLDVGSLMGSLVGETESRTRQALRLIDAMSPCVAFIDEVDKVLAGVQSGGNGDSGVSARMFGTFLSWLSDHKSDAFVVATCNDVSRLPPEFARAERFDAVFFLDLPGTAEKQRIWEQYVRHYQLPDQPLPASPGWTGAEVKSCCRLAALLDVPLLQAAEQVVPVAATASEAVRRLRSWAAGRCLDAANGGLYAPRGPAEGSATVPVTRRVDRGNGRN
jgi:hypothetical protein